MPTLSPNAFLKGIISVVLVYFILGSCAAQKNSPSNDEAAKYTKSITERADKIVAQLNISDSEKQTTVRDIIRNQYRNLNDLHTDRDQKMKDAKAQQADKNTIASNVNKIEEKADKKIGKLHKKYLEKLNAQLSPGQVEKVKDGMTYGVVPITYKGYLAMLPQLTEDQKTQIMTWLVEAREHAMSAESSEKKHGWFGKYKGKINNYLSAAGYDMKKASDEWAKKVKAEEAAKAH